MFKSYLVRKKRLKIKVFIYPGPIDISEIYQREKGQVKISEQYILSTLQKKEKKRIVDFTLYYCQLGCQFINVQ